jgi:hypothetical protein
MPLKEWDFFDKGGKKNSCQYWAICKACKEAGVESKVGGVQGSMQAHLRQCPNRAIEESEQKEIAGSNNNSSFALKKRKLSQTTFEVATKGIPFSKEQFVEFERQALRAALDANLAFHWTDSVEVRKLFQLMMPLVKMPRRKTVSGRVLDEANRDCIASGMNNLREHGKYGIALSMDAWKNIKKQSLLGSLGSVIGRDGMSYHLLKGMKDVTACVHDAEFMKLRISEDIASFKEDLIDVRAIVLDGAGECKKARKLLREDP